MPRGGSHPTPVSPCVWESYVLPNPWSHLPRTGLSSRFGSCAPVGRVQDRRSWQRRPALNGRHRRPAPEPAGETGVGTTKPAHRQVRAGRYHAGWVDPPKIPERPSAEGFSWPVRPRTGPRARSVAGGFAGELVPLAGEVRVDQPDEHDAQGQKVQPDGPHRHQPAGQGGQHPAPEKAPQHA